MGRSSEELRQILEKMKQDLLPGASLPVPANKMARSPAPQRTAVGVRNLKEYYGTLKLAVRYALLAAAAAFIAGIALKKMRQPEPLQVTAADFRPAAPVVEKKQSVKTTAATKMPVKAEKLVQQQQTEPPDRKVLPPSTSQAPAVADVQDLFFKQPAAYAGHEVELTLQIITAKRTQNGWRLNFAYTAPGKSMIWLYIDDTRVLGADPDLRIGYFYRVKFYCSRGEMAAGNTLSALKSTGQKAVWATDLSAIEQ